MEIFVGNIPPTIKAEELRFLYESFGSILFIDIKNRCQPPFAFILFDNAGSASNAAATTNGYQYQGYQFHVKLLHADDSDDNKTKGWERSLVANREPKKLKKSFGT